MKSKMDSFVVWKLRQGMDRRFRSGHPWVYSNELMASPKGLEPGAPVQLQDASGKFLAWGYGNPKSLIAFRALSRTFSRTLSEDPFKQDDASPQAVISALVKAGALRRMLGLGHVSHRLCFGEADALPGLVIDRYVVHKEPGLPGSGQTFGQVFVVQAHTAGAERWVPGILEILKGYVEESQPSEVHSSAPFNPIFWPISWDDTAVVLRNDLGVRKLEGLEKEEPRILREVPGMLQWQNARISIAPAISSSGTLASEGGATLEFQVDLLKGQKTGFFLDQFANIQLACLRFQHLSASKRKIRILDLCCYVGQWGAQLARFFTQMKVEVEVVAVDASQTALQRAKQNVENQGASCEIWEADVLKELGQLEKRSFDLVISDPPALIKSRKDIPVGKHAYLQLASQAFRVTKEGGGIVCCSCSGLLDEGVFGEILLKASQRSQSQVRWVARGHQSPDHPMLLEFPEGRYLKAWIGIQ